MDKEDEEIVSSEPILANKVNRFDSEFKFNEEDDMSGEEVETEDPFALDSEDSEFSGGFQALGNEEESNAGEIN
ncbi:MAG: hypothetical protein KBB86_00850 [Candidatus Pacebacteria bacterium]|nr:hypothetical protein [Candidatus Paceibacterota bacterium]